MPAATYPAGKVKLPIGDGEPPDDDEIRKQVADDEKASKLLDGRWQELGYESSSDGFCALTWFVLKVARLHGEATVDFLLDSPWGAGNVDSEHPGKYKDRQWVEADVARTYAKFGDRPAREVFAGPIEFPDDEAGAATTAASGPRRFEGLSLSQILDRPEPDYLVDDLIACGEVMMPFGPPGSCKTFVLLDLALSVAGHVPTWAGRDLRGGRVTYVLGEGQGRVRRRVEAWLSDHDQSVRDAVAENFRLIPEAVQILRPEWKEFLQAQTARDPSVVVFDTLSRCIAGANENDQAEMSRVVERMTQLKDATGATVGLIHHPGKDGRLERGSTVFRGAFDVLFRVEQGESGVVSLDFIPPTGKLKDGEYPEEPITFQLEKVVLTGQDRKGRPRTSARVTYFRNRLPLGLKHQHVKVLGELRNVAPEDKNPTQKQLETLCGLSRSTISRAVETLVKNGLATSERDGSSKRVAITEEGHRVVGEMSPFHVQGR